MGVDELSERYIKIHIKIVEECLRHTNEKGYLSLEIDNNFYLVSSEFIPGDFNRDEFNFSVTDMPYISPEERVVDAFYIYFSIRKVDNTSGVNIRKLVLQVDKI